jgi:hypothetical protein
MTNCLLTVILLNSSKLPCVFTKRSGTNIIYSEVIDRKLNKTFSHQPILPNVLSGTETNLFSAVLTKSGSNTKITVFYKNGVVNTLNHAISPLDAIELLNSDTKGNYLFDITVDDTFRYNTNVYTISHGKMIPMGSVKGRAIDVIGKKLVVIESGILLKCYNIPNLLTIDAKSELSKNMLRLYQKRHELSTTDNFHSAQTNNMPLADGSPQDGLRVSKNGSYWFESRFREFVAVGNHSYFKYFGGDVIISKRGMEWQWKYNSSTLRGCYFVNDNKFRFFRDERFAMGDKQIEWYSPGVYEVNLLKKSVVKLETYPITTKDLINKGYSLIPN